jgi:uncharacterized protein YciI
MGDYLYRLLATRAEMLTEGPTEREGAVVRSHFAHLSRLADENVVLLFGRTDAGADSFGVCVFRAEDEAAARRIMESDPAVVEGVMTAELFAFRMAGLGADLRGAPAR